jgi:hypothetical protein
MGLQNDYEIRQSKLANFFMNFQVCVRADARGRDGFGLLESDTPPPGRDDTDRIQFRLASAARYVERR